MDFALFWKFNFLLNGARKPPKMGWGVLSQLVVLILLIPHSTIFGQYFHFPLSLSTFTFQRKWKWNRRSEWSLYGCPENQCKGCDWIAIQDGLYLPPSSESQKIQNLEKCPSERGRNGSTWLDNQNVQECPKPFLNMIGHERSNVYPFQNNSSVHKSSAIAPPILTFGFWSLTIALAVLISRPSSSGKIWLIFDIFWSTWHSIGWGSLGDIFRMSQTMFLSTPVGLR